MSQGTPEIEIVRSFLKALEAQDLEQALTYVSDDVGVPEHALASLAVAQAAWPRSSAVLPKASAFEARINKIAANGSDGPDRTHGRGPHRTGSHSLPGLRHLRGPKNDRIVLWRDTFDWASGLVNAVIAGPLYAFRKVSMTIGMKVAARKA